MNWIDAMARNQDGLQDGFVARVATRSAVTVASETPACPVVHGPSSTLLALQRHVARRGPLSLAGLVLVLGSSAQAQQFDAGAVSLNHLDGVRSINALVDGSVQVTLENGAQVQIAAELVEFMGDGTVLVSVETAEVVAQAASAESVADIWPVVGLASLAGLGLAVWLGATTSVENTAAVITGATTETVTEDTVTVLTVSGALSVTDIDTGEAVFHAQNGTVGTYGSFDIDAVGAWTYTADNSQTAIQTLGAGETLTDSFTVLSADGTAFETVTVTINGVTEAITKGIELGAVSDNADLRGVIINGELILDWSGYSVSSAGDVNGDGFDDLIIGAPDSDSNAFLAGASFVVFGGNFSDVATQIGTIDDDDLRGTAGDDIIYSSGGTDRLSVGQGADIVIFGDDGGETTVTDFNTNEGDKLDLSNFGFEDFAAFEAVISADGPGGHDTRIDLGAGIVVFLDDISPDILTADHVILA
ncbi:VCBS domain-containing protein [Octadecabacter sp. G9-8]|uniref:VCBS domain-containing protein n=1 Tax=Octadecabacter dasysiphoniae TaxID=2909341 RepID=A0ABS9D105_9RHOB|nr:VCBS domain-containing protein [Octadecabacter dasysiphoniae]MCF2872310.1 VCBS domain-containing protein [Octadecabacter dasysiphoniae]